MLRKYCLHIIFAFFWISLLYADTLEWRSCSGKWYRQDQWLVIEIQKQMPQYSIILQCNNFQYIDQSYETSALAYVPIYNPQATFTFFQNGKQISQEQCNFQKIPHSTPFIGIYGNNIPIVESPNYILHSIPFIPNEPETLHIFDQIITRQEHLTPKIAEILQTWKHLGGNLQILQKDEQPIPTKQTLFRINPPVFDNLNLQAKYNLPLIFVFFLCSCIYITIIFLQFTFHISWQKILITICIATLLCLFPMVKIMPSCITAVQIQEYTKNFTNKTMFQATQTLYNGKFFHTTMALPFPIKITETNLWKLEHAHKQWTISTTYLPRNFISIYRTMQYIPQKNFMSLKKTENFLDFHNITSIKWKDAIYKTDNQYQICNNTTSHQIWQIQTEPWWTRDHSQNDSYSWCWNWLNENIPNHTLIHIAKKKYEKIYLGKSEIYQVNYIQHN
ncbi:MAG TPA: hypothetical protein P5543_00365 [Planctomycetota bacterium]|nr:hypothetical protein [Planctomycetota bacterium]